MSKLNKILFGVFTASLVAGTGVQTYLMIRGASSPNAPVYRDVNGDGINDKIIQRKVRNDGFFGVDYNDFENEVLFGVKVDGNIIYLPKDQFDGYKR